MNKKCVVVVIEKFQAWIRKLFSIFCGTTFQIGPWLPHFWVI